MTLHRRSRVVRQPPAHGSGESVILRLASAADGFPSWGQNWVRRDAALRAFLPTEPILEGAFFSTVARYAALGWRLQGPQRMVGMTRGLLHAAEFGQGWLPLILKTTQDIYGTDNGGFIEVVRETPNEPPQGLNHLDSGRCYRTGRDEEPVHYIDIKGEEHALKWFQVIPLCEFPSPIETANGAGVCAVSRVLKAAQLMRDIYTYKKQKISGRNIPAIHLVGGVSAKAVKDAMVEHETVQDNLGNTVYSEPVVIAGYSPEASVSKATIEIASLPDGFDEEVAMRMYLIIIANAFGIDFQDLAPLPGGNLGSGHQSQILDRKSKVKGPALFMQMMEHAMNFHGVLPLTVTFAYGEQDTVADSELASLAKIRAEERKIRIDSLEITPQIAAQRALDVGDLTPEEFAFMGFTDLTGGVTLQSSKALPGSPLDPEGSFWKKLWDMPEAWANNVGIVPARAA